MTRAICLTVSMALGCAGEIGSGSEPPTQEDNPATTVAEPAAGCQGAVSPARLRWLSPVEYQNTARDLLADPKAQVALASADGDIISALEVDRLGQAAAELVVRGGHR